MKFLKSLCLGAGVVLVVTYLLSGLLHPAGRYQLSTLSSSAVFILLDTTNGEVWLAAPGSRWVKTTNHFE